MADRLTRFLIEGVVQVALLYSPQLRPGLHVQKLVDEELVLVASWANPTMDLQGRYVFVDWGPEFVQAHAVNLPDLTNPGLTMALGAMTAHYILNRKAAAYLPARFVKRYLDQGLLHLVPEAPVFPYPVWGVWRDDLDQEIAKIAHQCLSKISNEISAAQDHVRQDLADISEDGQVETLGEFRHL